MITGHSITELAEKLAPAREQMDWRNPTIYMVERGCYKVSGSTGNFYEVTCGRNSRGVFFIACTCKLALFYKPCYHALKAFESHLAVMERPRNS